MPCLLAFLAPPQVGKKWCFGKTKCLVHMTAEKGVLTVALPHQKLQERAKCCNLPYTGTSAVDVV